MLKNSCNIQTITPYNCPTPTPTTATPTPTPYPTHTHTHPANMLWHILKRNAHNMEVFPLTHVYVVIAGKFCEEFAAIHWNNKDIVPRDRMKIYVIVLNGCISMTTYKQIYNNVAVLSLLVRINVHFLHVRSIILWEGSPFCFLWDEL